MSFPQWYAVTERVAAQFECAGLHLVVRQDQIYQQPGRALPLIAFSRRKNTLAQLSMDFTSPSLE